MKSGTGAVSRARIIDAGERTGIPYARNTGAREAEGRLLAFCDADDEVDAHWVAALSRGVKRGLGGGKVNAVRPGGRADSLVFSDSLMQTTYLPHVPGCNFAVERTSFFAVGGFDESLPPYGCDDLEFSWRVQECGQPITYVPEACVSFTITPRTRVVRKEFLMAKARMAVAARHPDSMTAKLQLRHYVWAFAQQLAQLPWRMIRPGSVPRTRWIRWTVDAAGRLSGYWTYFLRGDANPPKLLP